MTYASATPGNYTSYSYDGLNRRTLKTNHISTTSIVRHYYYSDQWQVLEERMGTSTNANDQYVWGQRYVDDMVLRERDTTGSGTLDERLYAMQDANWNVVAICDTSAAVQERYVYAGYGMQSFLTASYAPSTSSYIWIYLFTGREWEAEVGLLYCRNRHYHPLLGTWTQKDLIGYDGGDVNLYRYVLNNPITLIDLSGLLHVAGPADNLRTTINDFLDGGPPELWLFFPITRSPIDLQSTQRLRGYGQSIQRSINIASTVKASVAPID